MKGEDDAVSHLGLQVHHLEFQFANDHMHRQLNQEGFSPPEIAELYSFYGFLGWNEMEL